MKNIILSLLTLALFTACTTSTIKTIQTRASCREFNPSVPVTDEQLDTILHSAMSAPSGLDHRPWEFIVVRDKSILTQISQKLPYSRTGEGATAAIIVCGNPETSPSCWIEDCSAASQNILLSAHAQGLGAVWTAVHPDPTRTADLRSILSIPSSIIPLNVIPLGTPTSPLTPKNKWNPSKIHSNKW